MPEPWVPPILQERARTEDLYLTVDASGAAYYAENYDDAVRKAFAFGHTIYKRTTTISDWSEIIPIGRKT